MLPLAEEQVLGPGEDIPEVWDEKKLPNV